MIFDMDRLMFDTERLSKELWQKLAQRICRTKWGPVKESLKK